MQVIDFGYQSSSFWARWYLKGMHRCGLKGMHAWMGLSNPRYHIIWDEF
jgi:hypothetical protein